LYIILEIVFVKCPSNFEFVKPIRNNYVYVSAKVLYKTWIIGSTKVSSYFYTMIICSG